MHRIEAGYLVVVLVGVAVLLSGCAPSQPAKARMSVLSLKTNGRTINATVPAPSFIQQEGENVVVTSETHKLVIERERIVLNGEDLVKIPAETANIQMWISESGLLTMNRDGMALATKQL